MSNLVIKLHGIPEALRAFDGLPHRVRFKHLRIALNAGGGVIRDRAAQLARRRTGLLANSLGVKVAIPDASFNKAHHGKPAYAAIGVKRKAGRMMRLNTKRTLKGFGAAQKSLVAERKRLQQDGKLPPLRREQAAVKATLTKHPEAVYINPSRYAHLLEKGHAKGRGRSAAKGYPFISTAVAQTKQHAIDRVAVKLGEGIDKEAAALAAGG